MKITDIFFSFALCILAKKNFFLNLPMWTWSTLNVTRLVLITRKLLPGHGNTIRLYSYLIKEFSNSLSVMQRIVYKFFFYNDTQNRNASVPHVSHKLSKLKQFIFQKKKKSCKFRGFFFSSTRIPASCTITYGS